MTDRPQRIRDPGLRVLHRVLLELDKLDAPSHRRVIDYLFDCDMRGWRRTLPKRKSVRRG